MSNSILVVGSVAFDHVKTNEGERPESLGGSATYFSYSASYFAPVRLVGVIGNDFPDKYIQLLEKRSIDTQGLIRQDGKTFRWAGSYERDLNEADTLSTDLNVFADFNPVLPESYRDSDFVFLANIDPDLQLNVLEQVTSPKYIVCDTMNLWIDIKKDSLIKLLGKVDLFIVNDAESKMLTGKSNLIAAAREILKLGPKTVIVKKGEHGALAISGDELFILPAYPLERVVDPTGAGDTFAGGTVGYLAKTGSTKFDDIRNAVVYGTVMASFNVENFSLDNLIGLNDDKINERVNALMNVIKI